MIKTLNDYRELGTIKDILPNEKEQYISFLEILYKDDARVSEFLLVKFPRWSIISGYYAMHDISKLYLARKFNLKLSQPNVHQAAIQALREFVKRKEILELLTKAEDEYNEIITLHLALSRGKEEREKSQYYTSESVKPHVSIEKSSYFLEKLVKPYIKLIEELLK